MNTELAKASNISDLYIVRLHIHRFESCLAAKSVLPSTTVLSICLKCVVLLESIQSLYHNSETGTFTNPIEDTYTNQDKFRIDEFLYRLLDFASQISDDEDVRKQLKAMLNTNRNELVFTIKSYLQTMLSLSKRSQEPVNDAVYNALLKMNAINQKAFQIEQNFDQQMTDLYTLMRAGKATSIDIENFLNGERARSNFKFYIVISTYINTTGLIVKLNQRNGLLVQWRTALIDAVINNNPEQVYAHRDKLLQQSQEWIDLTDSSQSSHNAHVKLSSFNLSALMAAAWYNHVQCVQLLLEEMGLQDKLGYTALMMAAQNGSTEAASLLLAEAGFSDELGFTALMAAASNGHTEIVTMLVSRESCMQNKEGTTALMLATSRNHTDAVRILVDYEAGMCDNDGMTALMIASANGCLQIVGLLLSKEIGHQDKSGWTAMIWAAQRCSYWSMKLLLPYEGEIKDNAGKGPMDHVLCSSHVKPLDKQRCLLLLA